MFSIPVNFGNSQIGRIGLFARKIEKNVLLHPYSIVKSRFSKKSLHSISVVNIISSLQETTKKEVLPQFFPGFSPFRRLDSTAKIRRFT